MATTCPTGWGASSGAAGTRPCSSGCSTASPPTGGQFPPLPELGSRLYLPGRESLPQRLSAARLYVAEALAEEAVSIKDVALAPAGEGRSEVTVQLSCRGEELAVTVMV